MKKIVFFVPKSDAENVKDAVFKAGAGTIGNYDNCCFDMEGIGQFRPLEGANPYIGSQNKVEKVVELRVETICPDGKIEEVLKALRLAHPYEEPAIDVYELLNF